MPNTIPESPSNLGVADFLREMGNWYRRATVPVASRKALACDAGAQAYEIVRNLAGMSPYAETQAWCSFCGAWEEDDTTLKDQSHADDCIWLTARRLIDQAGDR